MRLHSPDRKTVGSWKRQGQVGLEADVLEPHFGFSLDKAHGDGWGRRPEGLNPGRDG